MKNSKITISVLLYIVTSIAIFSQDVPKIKAEHLKMVAKYEEQVKAQGMIAEEHSKMKKEYVKKYFINEKLSNRSTINEMEKHCDKIIEEANQLKKNFQMMADFHKSLAAELDKK
ncbi:MAG TPA: hypothetical protein PK079_23750 [Leptospiraceae bacterium]|nr:hypothetical protein [Leptospiraceae bacterium]HMW05382.1 hypothetical protein [Leptospiraceae bacterium]HMX32826.1 hypothetical protein [Leptospiraceae bacterium]HMY33866.1 hypothetical protein [Leptospiraceae bacterium]HMZ64484.1 hypothetical protein [Leptospiraceae bacterium]